MSLTKKILYGLWIAVLVGIVAFTSVAIYKYVDSEKYKRNDDIIYTFSELTGITEKTEINYVSYKISERSANYTPDYGVGYDDPEDIEVIRQYLLEMRFVETYEDIGDEVERLVVHLLGKNLTIYTGEKACTFRFGKYGKKYRAIGVHNFYEIPGVQYNNI